MDFILSSFFFVSLVAFVSAKVQDGTIMMTSNELNSPQIQDWVLQGVIKVQEAKRAGKTLHPCAVLEGTLLSGTKQVVPELRYELIRLKIKMTPRMSSGPGCTSQQVDLSRIEKCTISYWVPPAHQPVVINVEKCEKWCCSSGGAVIGKPRPRIPTGVPRPTPSLPCSKKCSTNRRNCPQNDCKSKKICTGKDCKPQCVPFEAICFKCLPGCWHKFQLQRFYACGDLIIGWFNYGKLRCSKINPAMASLAQSSS